MLKVFRFDLTRHLTEALAACKGSAFEGHSGGVAFILTHFLGVLRLINIY